MDINNASIAATVASNLYQKPKSGFFTSEFWLTLLNSVAGGLVMGGILTPPEADALVTGLHQTIGGLMIVIPTIAYIYSRIVVKSNKPISSASIPPLPMSQMIHEAASVDEVVVE